MGDRAAFDVDDVFRKAELLRRQASGIAANASLISMRSTSASFQSGALERQPDRRHRADAEHARLDRRDAVRDQPRQRRQPVRFREGALGHDHRRGAAVEPGRVAGRDGAVLAKGRVQLGERLERRLGPMRFVLGESSTPFLPRSSIATISSVELARGLRSGEALLRARRPAVLILAADCAA